MDIHDWYRQWQAIAAYTTEDLPDPDVRIRLALELWQEEVPTDGIRSYKNLPNRLRNLPHSNRYARSNADRPKRGEHVIEDAILCEGAVKFEDGAAMFDGVNAFPLSIDPGGGRKSNVEADLLLLIQRKGTETIVAAEVKVGSNNPWYALVENLRQLRLLYAGQAAQSFFSNRRDKAGALTSTFGAMVIAPREYYEKEGQKGNSMKHALSLISAFRKQLKVDLSLVQWDPGARTLTTRTAPNI